MDEKENEEKKISEMTNEEILRKQLELFPENSKYCTVYELPEMTEAMCKLYKTIIN